MSLMRISRSRTCISCLAILAPWSGVASVIPFAQTNNVDIAFLAAECVYIADVDGDGDLDLLGAAVNAKAIAFWRNVGGSGTNWEKLVIVSDFDGARDVSAGDLDGDGDVDVLGVANDAIGSDDQVRWWENLDRVGSNWSVHVVDDSFLGARNAKPADIDGDGDLDVVGAAVDQGLRWWSNNGGDGTSWSERVIEGSLDTANDVVAADVDHDGDLDVCAVAGGGTNTVAWWENLNGSGTNWSQHVVGTGLDNPWSVFAADVDGDGDIDLLGANRFNDEFLWWANMDGTGTTWATNTVAVGPGEPYDVRAIDVDHDGDLDVLGTAVQQGRVTWWENVGGFGLLWMPHVVGQGLSSPRSAVAGDLDSDGDTDVAHAESFSGGRARWVEDVVIHRRAAFCREAPIDENIGPADLAAADVDGDGDADLIAARPTGFAISWWENSAFGTTWTPHLVATGLGFPAAVESVDLDRDGDADLLGAMLVIDGIAWWENLSGEGTNWQQHAIHSNFLGSTSIAAGDVNWDGAPDVIAAGNVTNSISWWENVSGSATSWVQHVVVQNLQGAVDAAGVDVDRDGDLDIIGAGQGASLVAWWENAGGAGTSWVQHAVDSTFTGVVDVTCTDLDRDGDWDLMGVSGPVGALKWWENMDGTGTAWTTHTVTAGVTNLVGISAGDLDHDGDADLVTFSSTDGARCWENVDGSGTAWVDKPFGVQAVPTQSGGLADLDGDSYLDVAVGRPGGTGDLLWWPNDGGQFALLTTNVSPSTVLQGSTNALFSVLAQHLGRPGDSPEELVSLDVLFQQTAGDPLTTGEGNALMERLRVYQDDGSGHFETTSDTVIATVETLALAAGVESIFFSDGDPLVQFTTSTALLLHVVAEWDPAAANAGVVHLEAVHLTDTEASASLNSGQDSVYDINLARACSALATASVLVVGLTDVGAEKAASPVTVLTDSNIIYTVSVSNLTAVDALSVVVTDALPAGVSFNSALSSGECVETDDVVVCTLGRLYAESGQALSIAVIVHTNTVGVLTNYAMVSSLSPDTNAVNNTALATNTIVDTDADGQPNFADTDDDNDAMPDGWEIDNLLDPLDSADASDDDDMDTQLNVEEYVADTNPHDSNSFFVIDGIATGSTPGVTFESAEERLYTLQYLDNLITGTWSNVPGRVDMLGDPSGEDSLDDPNATTPRSYRIKVRLQ